MHQSLLASLFLSCSLSAYATQISIDGEKESGGKLPLVFPPTEIALVVDEAPTGSLHSLPREEKEGRDQEKETSAHKPVNLKQIGTSDYAKAPNTSSVPHGDFPERLILSLDGGGIRGKLLAIFLSWLEEEVKIEINKHSLQGAPSADVRLGECFDLMAGTSTGALIALGMNVPEHGRPRYNAVTFNELYEKKGSLIFPKKGLLTGWLSAKFSPKALEQTLLEYFGDFTLKDLLKPMVITTYDIHQEELFLFKSRKAHDSESKNYYLKDVARASSAAPTYFPAADVKNVNGTSSHTFVDGGVTANNPMLLAYLEAQKLYPHTRFQVISMGCGVSSLFTLESKQKGGKLQWAGDISSVLMNSASSMTHVVVAEMAALRGDSYIRLQLPLDQQISALDDATPENLRALQGYADREIHNPDSPLHKIRKVLIDFYAAREFYTFYPLLTEISRQLQTTPSELSLSDKYLTERALWEISDFLAKQSWSIKRLDLSLNAVTPAYFQWLRSFQALKFLDLSATQLNPDSLKVLNSIALPRLKGINITHNPDLEGLSAAQDLLLLITPYKQVLMDPSLTLRLGTYFEKERKAYKEAASYYQQGYPDVANQLALIKLLVSGVVPEESEFENMDQGFTACQALAQQGNAEAQYILGHLYYHLEKYTEDYFFAKGLLQPQEETQEIALRPSKQQAAYWYHLAANQKHKAACLGLARMYYEHEALAPAPQKGLRTEATQLETALTYYRLAQQAGSESAIKNILAIETELKALQEQ